MIIMGRFLHKFQTESEFIEAYNGEEYHKPWVSLVKETEDVEYNKEDFDFKPEIPPVLNPIEA